MNRSAILSDPKIHKKYQGTTTKEENNIPFISKFRTKDHCYIYDVNTNTVYKVDPITYHFIDKIGKEKEQIIIDSLSHRYPKNFLYKRLKELNDIIINGKAFKALYPKKLVPPSMQEIRQALNRGLRNMTLILTEKCNLRCKYCVYSGHYFYERRHSSLSMSTEIAFRAIDFFFDHAVDTKKIAIGFYGGEPLLEFDLLKKCVLYAKEKNKNNKKNIFLNLTTNLTMLTDSMLDFLKNNGIVVVASLDGPRENHDRYRVFKNGKGTYDLVLKNIEKINRKYPSYLKKYVSYNTVLCPPYDLKNYIEFVESRDDLFCDGKFPSINRVIPYNNDLFEDNIFAKLSTGKSFKLIRKGMLKEYRNLVLKRANNPRSFLRRYFDSEFNKIRKRSRFSKIDEEFRFKHICIPGHSRMIISPLGKIHYCPNITSSMSIGDLENGFDINKTKELIDEYYRISERECCKCWAIRFCNICYFSAVAGENFSSQIKRIDCKKRKTYLKQILATYMEIQEKDPTAFDFC